jgi:hypothetical protein
MTSPSCPRCGATVLDQQRFCSACGTALHWSEAAAPSTADASQTVVVVEQTGYGPLPPPTSSQPPPPPLTPPATPTTVYVTVPAAPFEDPHRGRIPLYLAAGLTLTSTIVALVTRVYRFEADFDGGRLSDSMTLGEVSTQASVGLIIGLVLLLAGAVAAGSGRRFGAGLAGGGAIGVASLAAALMAVIVGIYEDTADRVPTNAAFILIRTYDVGFFALAAAVGGGVLTLLLSMWAGGSESRRALHPALVALGVVAILCATIGQLIPTQGQAIADQFGSDTIDVSVASVRLVSLALFGFAGVLGFAHRRMWGMGCALASCAVAAWALLGTQIDLGGAAMAIGIGTIGTGGVLTPDHHPVTVVGLLAAFVAAAIGVGMMVSRPTR